MYTKWLTQWHPKVIASDAKQHLANQAVHPYRPTIFIVSQFGSTTWDKWYVGVAIYRTRMPNSALKCRLIILITARSLCSYNNFLINFGQLYSNSCYTTFSIATLGMCIACEFHQLWAMRPCIYHIFRHLTKWLIFCRTGHACTVCANKW